MAIFGKKNKKSPEELRKEREAKITSTSNSLRLQIVTLEKKKDILLRKVMEARQKGLKEQEQQARSLLKQTMAAIKRENGMLMTLELAIESRDLAQLNSNFLESIGALSDDILSSGKINSEANTKRIGNKFLRAVYESNQQKERIDDMLAIGEYSSVINQDGEQYSEFDDEIDGLLEGVEQSQMGFVNNTPTRNRY
ncbi:MAG: hypothetical protein IJX30_06080 [Clostridia bacterium]|nr:hypothetical protein [Clostridia bacterium]